MPFYKSGLSPDEKVSLRHLQRYLAPYDKYLVAPRSLCFSLDGFGIRRFDDRHFASSLAFGNLQLSAEFYRAFADYEHMLLYQLDALVFANRLLEFCVPDYDYIGAPWIAPTSHLGPAVGNGGFSLRRVERFLAVLESRRHRVRLSYWRGFARGAIRHRPGDNSDLFWSFDAPRRDSRFRVASVEQALRFAFEVEPRTCFELAGRRLPFGCHAWTRYDRAFWEPYLLAE